MAREVLYSTVVCWRCGVLKDGVNVMDTLLNDVTLPETYATVLLTGSMVSSGATFLQRVVAYESYGTTIDSFTCFCDNCMKITMHTQRVDETCSSEQMVLHAVHYIQKALCELDTLHKFGLLPS
jgi:hypothetical protein